MAPRHRASASVPLHASVASTGVAGVPNSPTASRACTWVNGSTTCASVQFRRSTPKRPRLAATPRSDELAASVGPWAVSVSTRDLLDGDVLRAEAIGSSSSIASRLLSLVEQEKMSMLTVPVSGHVCRTACDSLG